MGLIRDIMLKLLRGKVPLAVYRKDSVLTQVGKDATTDNDQFVSDTIRCEAYSLFGSMERDPILAPALNVYADEVASGTGMSSEQPFRINTNSKQAAKVIEGFQKTVTIAGDPYLHYIHDTCRDVTQFGDVLFEIVCDKNRVLRLVNLLPETMRYIKVMETWTYKNGESKSNESHRYQQYQLNKGWETFEPWQIAHLRGAKSLSKQWGFTSSIFWPIQGIWKLGHYMLDAMAVDRIYSSHHARLFLVDTGDLEGMEAWDYVDMLKDRYRRKPSTDPTTGELLLYGGLPIPEDDVFIPHGTGNETDVKELYGSHYRPISDIEFVILLECVGIGVPPQRLGILKDIRTRAVSDVVYLQFSKNVQRIRLAIERGIGKAIEIQLSLAGLKSIDHPFWFTWPPISIERIMNEMETLKLRAQIASVLTMNTGVYLSDEWIYREVLGMSDDAIRDMLSKKPADYAPAALQKKSDGDASALRPEHWQALLASEKFNESLTNLKALLDLKRGRMNAGVYQL